MKKRVILLITLFAINTYAQAPQEFLYTPTNLSGTMYGQVQIDGLVE